VSRGLHREIDLLPFTAQQQRFYLQAKRVVSRANFFEIAGTLLAVTGFRAVKGFLNSLPVLRSHAWVG
jgi:hypothetical protein